jgi:hypothetical protein
VVRLANPKLHIKAGVSGFVRFRRAKAVATLPATAVIDSGSKAAVFTVREGRAHMQLVQLGPIMDNGMYQVRAGVAPGDEVVIFHNFYRHTETLSSSGCYLQENDLVDTNWRRWAGRD